MNLRLNPSLWRHSVLLPAAVVFAGLCAAIAGGLWLQGSADDDAEAAFQRKLTRAAEEVSMHFRLPLYGLKGARSLYVTHASVSRDIFRSYVRSRDMALEFPGVRGFGYIERVPRSGLPAFLERTRLDGAPGFALRQLGDSSQPEHFVVKFIEPAEANAGAAGVDLASEAVRRQGLVEAVATGEATVTGVITLVQDQRQSSGVLLYLPLYEDSDSNREPSARLLRGVLTAPIVISELLDGLSDVHSGQLRVALFDTASGTTLGPKMFDSAAADSTSVQAARRPRFEATTIVTLPGRLVTLRASSTAAFDAQAQTLAPWLFFGGTLAASLMLAGLLRQQASGRQRAERIAQGMTADLSRLALVARRSSNAVVITDLQRRITWVNAGFERITGYSTAEALGQSPGQLLQGKATDPATVLRMRQALDARQGFNGEILNRRKDGKVYWMLLDIQPLHDDAGTLVGFMAIQLDITVRKQAERDLLRERQSLQNVIEGTHAGTWEWNVETGEAVYNERWAQIAGYTLAELGAPGPEIWNRLAHPDDLQRSKAVMERHFAGLSEAYECEVRMLHKEGHWVWVLASGKLFSRSADGRPRWMAGTHMDISARKQAEAALQASQAFLSQTGRIGGVGGWELDLETQAFDWTDETCKLFEVAVGHRPSIPEALDFWPQAAQQLIIDAVQNSVLTGQSFDFDLPVVTAKGRHLWMRTVGEPKYVDGAMTRLVGAFQDISARRALEAALRNKNDLLNAVLDNLPCGLSVFDSDHKSVLANRELHRLLDLPPSLMQQPGLSFEDIVRFDAARGEYGPGDREELVRKTLARVSGPDLVHHFERVRPDGTTLEVRGAPMPSGGFVTTYTDISARRQAEAEARRNAELLRGAVDALDDAFVLYGPDDRLVMCNQRYRDIYPESAVMMEPGNSFEDIARYGAEHGQYASTGGSVDDWVAERVALHRQPHSRLTQLLANGRTLRIVERRMADGHTVGIRVDITNLVRATEQAVQASEDASRSLARLQAIYDILPMGLAITDPQGHIIDCNPASERLLGISREEHLRRDYTGGDWAVLREDGTPMPTEELPGVRALTGGVAVTDALMQVVTPERALWLSVSAMPVQHDALGVVIAYADVTEQRQQRQALLAAKAQAEQASVAKSQFLANMSHEIRTPMNAILGMLALLKKTGLSARQADYAGKTEGAARSLLGLLNDILDFSKVEAGKMLLDPHPFRIDALMRDLSVIVSANVGAKPVEVLFDIDPALPRRLVGDAMRLRQVLINLSGNAIKFTDSGEVVVSVRVLAQSGGSVTLRVAVRDTGIGIAPQNQARIFSGFTQAEASTTRRFGGSGLGVAISQRLVALMGGELQLDSVLGQGSTFHFILTLAVATGDGAEPAPIRQAQALRALVVDDNATARNLLQGMAQSLGWAVDAADSSEAALALLRNLKARGDRYDAVFVDWQMPGLDGGATTRQIRDSGLAGDAPVVVMVTAHGREMLEQRSGDEQALPDGFLVKPVTASMLLDAVVDARLGPAGRAGQHHHHSHPHPAARVATAAGARLAGMRLLVAEDNLNNQQVARELLEDEGAEVQVAANGQIAVEAVAAADPPFDAVLMDLQMPVMDGFTATARIRQDLHETSLPIVAMTANAMASDREACLAAGMNEHVGKPFDIDHLVQVLRRVAGRTTGAGARAASAPSALPATASAEVSAEVSAAATAAGVQLAPALRRLSGKVPVYARMLRRFVHDLADMQAVLTACLQTQDSTGAGRTLHTLKGLAATLGIQALADAAARAEQAPGLQGPTQDILKAMAQARPALATLHAALHAELQSSLATTTSALTLPAPSGASLTELITLLESSDMRATEVMATLQKQCAPSPALQALEAAVCGLDFERALAVGRTLLAETAP